MRWVNCAVVLVLVHGHVMNFKEEKMDLPLSYLSPEPVDWYANDQATNKALLS